MKIVATEQENKQYGEKKKKPQPVLSKADFL